MLLQYGGVSSVLYLDKVLKGGRGCPLIGDIGFSLDDKVLDISVLRCYNPPDIEKRADEEKAVPSRTQRVGGWCKPMDGGIVYWPRSGLAKRSITSSRRDGGRPLQRHAVVGSR